MKPAWDQLMEEFKSDALILIADVDCTGDGKGLCEERGVTSYPALKYGDPNNLDDYKGSRIYNDLLLFVKSNLGPSCSPFHFDLCDDEQKVRLKKILGMGPDRIEQEILKIERVKKKTYAIYESSVKKLQAQYEVLEREKDEIIAEARRENLGLLKSVRAVKIGRSNKHDDL